MPAAPGYPVGAVPAVEFVVADASGDAVGALPGMDEVIMHAALKPLRQLGAVDQVLAVGIEAVDRDAGRVGLLPVGDIVVDADVMLVVDDVDVVIDLDGAVAR